MAISPYEKARLYIENKTKDQSTEKRTGTGPVITFSREAGIGCLFIAYSLVDYLKTFQKDQSLDWGVFDKNLIEKVLEEHKLPSELRKYLEDSEKASNWQGFMNEIFGIHPSILSMQKKIFETIHDLGTIGNVIIIGRGGSFITKDLKNSLHIRLIAPEDFRVRNVMNLYDKTKTEAVNFVKNEDINRKKFVKELFHQDVDNCLNYHITLNTEKFSENELARIIGDAVIAKFPDFFHEKE